MVNAHASSMSAWLFGVLWSSDVKRYTINDISFVQIDIRILNCHSAYRK